MFNILQIFQGVITEHDTGVTRTPVNGFCYSAGEANALSSYDLSLL